MTQWMIFSVLLLAVNVSVFVIMATVSYQISCLYYRRRHAPKSKPDSTIIASPMDDRYGISCFSNGNQHSYFFRTGQLETLSKRVMADAANPDHPLSEKLAVQILERCYVMVSSYEKNGATL